MAPSSRTATHQGQFRVLVFHVAFQLCIWRIYTSLVKSVFTKNMTLLFNFCEEQIIWQTRAENQLIPTDFSGHYISYIRSGSIALQISSCHHIQSPNSLQTTVSSSECSAVWRWENKWNNMTAFMRPSLSLVYLAWLYTPSLNVSRTAKHTFD